MTTRKNEAEAARYWLCQTLSPFRKDEIAAPPADLWPRIVRQADGWLVGPRLYLLLQDQGILPPEAADLLEAVTDLADARARSMRADLLSMIGAFNAAGLEPVVIKGAEWLLGHYAPHALRPIADLDIWFPTEPEQDAAIDVLQSQGYQPAQPIASHDKATAHHFPPFHKGDEGPRFELHHRLVRSTLKEAMDLDQATTRLKREDFAGHHYLRLAPIDGVTVAFLQSGRMAMPPFLTRRVPLAKWLDFMDRFQAAGLPPVSTTADIGIIDGHHRTDRQLLTTLAVACGFPYQGPADRSYLKDWAQEVTVAKSLRRAFTWEKALSPRAWISLIRYFPKRVKAVRFLNSL